MKRRPIALACMLPGILAAGFLAGCSAATSVGSTSAEASTLASRDNAGKGTDASTTSGAVNPDETITVSGTGTVTVTPDTAQISLGVQTMDKSTKDAQTKNTASVNAVIAALKAAGVAEKNITTSGLDIYANYDYNDSGSGSLTGYTVTTTLQVDQLKVSDVGKLIDVATDAGANQVNGINYSYSDSITAYDQALEAAIDRAEEKAQKIADKAGKTLNGIKDAEENSNSYDTPVDSGKYAAASASEDSSMEVLAGESDVSATVTVTYYFK